MNRIKHRLLMIVMLIIMALTLISCNKSDELEAVNKTVSVNSEDYISQNPVIEKNADITGPLKNSSDNGNDNTSDSGNPSDNGNPSDSVTDKSKDNATGSGKSENIDNFADSGKSENIDNSTAQGKAEDKVAPADSDKSPASEKPNSADKPKASEASKNTDKQGITDTPKNTDKAKLTEAPKNADKPDITEKAGENKATPSYKAEDKAKSEDKVDIPAGSDNIKETDKTDSVAEKKVVAIDAGHQRKGNYDTEPIGPGAKTTKAKVSSGTQGRYTKVPEYELNLVVAKKVKDELISRGYEVVMIRETHDVDLSNKERADIANKSGADIFIRIHANGSENTSVNGTSTLYPSKKNPYIADLSAASLKLSQAIVDVICDYTGSKNRGAVAHDDMSGINWSKIPVTIIEMGYMTNEKEDKLMQTEDYQNKIAQGICDGIDKYFKQ